MSRFRKETPLDREFIDALVALCEQYQRFIRAWHVQYDEFDSDSGLEVVPISHDWDLDEIRTALCGKP